MAEFDTIRSVAGARTAEIDEGLRAHMNKVYGTMSVGMLITFLAAWAVGNNAAMMETLFTGMTRWVVMFAPLIFVFGLSAGINRLSAAAAQTAFYAFAAVMGLSISSIFHCRCQRLMRFSRSSACSRVSWISNQTSLRMRYFWVCAPVLPNWCCSTLFRRSLVMPV